MNTAQTTDQTTTPVIKKSLWSTLIWISYFILTLSTLSNLFLFLIFKSTNNKDIVTSSTGVTVSMNTALITTIITLIIFSILTVYSIKRKKTLLKIAPVLETILYFVGIANSIIVLQLNAISMLYLIGSILFTLIRPAIILFVIYKNKADYIS